MTVRAEEAGTTTTPGIDAVLNYTYIIYIFSHFGQIKDSSLDGMQPVEQRDSRGAFRWTDLGTTDWGVVARAVHALAVVVWIGGVWLVTTVLLPAMKAKPPEAWIQELGAIERRFAPQVRIAVVLVLLGGLYMLYRYDLWERFRHSEYWWMHLMVGVWMLFAALLFVVEPFVLRRLIHRGGARASGTTLALTLWPHRAMPSLSARHFCRGWRKPWPLVAAGRCYPGAAIGIVPHYHTPRADRATQ
jgi:uncharacterized membrane protein